MAARHVCVWRSDELYRVGAVGRCAIVFEISWRGHVLFVVLFPIMPDRRSVRSLVWRSEVLPRLLLGGLI